MWIEGKKLTDKRQWQQRKEPVIATVKKMKGCKSCPCLKNGPEK